jgi:hypothetical protein
MWRSCIHILLKSGLSKDKFAAGFADGKGHISRGLLKSMKLSGREQNTTHQNREKQNMKG